MGRIWTHRSYIQYVTHKRMCRACNEYKEKKFKQKCITIITYGQGRKLQAGEKRSKLIENIPIKVVQISD